LVELGSSNCKQGLVIVELEESFWVEGGIVDRKLRIEGEYLAPAEVNDVAAFAC
jgi:hypothetical protein